MLITKSQIVKLHALLNKAGLMEHKKEIVQEYSHKKSTSSKQLTLEEARALIDYLESLVNNQDSKSRMIKKIFAICRSLGWIYGNSPEDRKMNNAKLGSFIERKGYLKKPLKDYNESELPGLVSQFESIQKNIEKSKANKEVKELLAELNLTV